METTQISSEWIDSMVYGIYMQYNIYIIIWYIIYPIYTRYGTYNGIYLALTNGNSAICDMIFKLYF